MRLAMPLGLETMGLMLWDHEPIIQPLPRNGGLGFQNRVRVELCTSTIGPGYISLGGAEVKARASRVHRGSVRIFKLGRVMSCLRPHVRKDRVLHSSWNLFILSVVQQGTF